MPELNPDGLPVHPAPGVTLRTPGLRGEVVLHAAGSDGMRGAEETRQELLEALRHNDLEEDLTVEITDARETDESEGSRAAGGVDDMTLEVPDPGEAWGQVVLYESEEGVLSWHLPYETRAGAAMRGSGTLTYRIPRAVPPADAQAEAEGGGQRGVLGAVGSKILKVLTFRLVKAGAGWVGGEFARAVEKKYRPHALVRFTPESSVDPKPAELTDSEIGRLGEGRALLLVHGTASTTYNAFHRIPPDVLAGLHARYDGRVVAFNHPTVGSTPVENVTWLAQRLAGLGVPALEVDVLCHSRGGLVSRVLTERPDLAGATGRLDVRNLVMVAAPNAGTALADVDNLEHLLNRLTTLIQLVPDNGVTDVLDVILSVLKQVATGVLSGLDGLMSMNPKGRFLTEDLNVAGKNGSTYFAVAANYDPPAGTPLMRIARDSVTDVVFGQAHNDLVVPTEGVFTVPGAGMFPVAERLVFETDAKVDHSGFWPRPELGQRLAAWLPG